MANGRSTIQRNPTFPLSKRDSVASTTSRMSLVSNCNTGGRSHNGTPPMTNGRTQRVAPADRNWQVSDFVNTNPKMVGGTKRTGKKVKRTDSYKKATERSSAVIDDGFDMNSNSNKLKSITRKEDRTKYNTLPIKPNESVQRITKIDLKQKPTSQASTESFNRSESQKSGRYYPSPDTDDDQHTTLPDRKKKSAFRRMKERLSRTFSKDRVSKTKTSDRGIAGRNNSSNPDRQVAGSSSSNSGHSASHRCTVCGGLLQTVSKSVLPEPRDGILSTFRNSIRRKRSHSKYNCWRLSLYSKT